MHECIGDCSFARKIFILLSLDNVIIPAVFVFGVIQDALNTACTTPDCDGKLSNIKVVGANGLLKTEVRLI